MERGHKLYGISVNATNNSLAMPRVQLCANGRFSPLRPSTLNANCLTRFEIATESQEGNQGSADTQNYYNTTLVLKDPDPQLGTRFVKTGQITATNPITTDGGKTWFIEKVTIPPMLPPGSEWKPPAPPPPAVSYFLP
jgi:hypothetical protein